MFIHNRLQYLQTLKMKTNNFNHPFLTLYCAGSSKGRFKECHIGESKVGNGEVSSC